MPFSINANPITIIPAISIIVLLAKPENAFEKSKPFFLDICKRYPLESLSFVRYNSPTERCRDVSSVWDIGVHDYALFYELKRIAPLTDWRRVQVTFDEGFAPFMKDTLRGYKLFEASLFV